MAPRIPLGSILLERGLVTQAQLEAAVAEQARTGQVLGRVLVSHGAITELDLVKTLAEQSGLEYVDLAEQTVDPTASSMITDSLARRYQALPIGWEGATLLVAIADPANVLAVDDIRSLVGADGP